MPSTQPKGPDFFLVGAPKCGTTSMYEYLRRHPQIFFPVDESGYGRAKEPQHFCPDLQLSDRYAIHDRDEYLALYAGSDKAVRRGDASTYYLYSKAAPSLIREYCPQARILIMLRPPLQMIRSYHSELLRWGQEDITDFHEALEAIDDRKKGRRLPRDPGIAKALDYIDLCRVAPQVSRYVEMFGRDAVKVVLLEDMIESPVSTYREVLRFLSVDPDFQPEFRVYNEAPRNGILERMLKGVYMHPLVHPMARALVPYRVRRRALESTRHIVDGSTPRDPRDRNLQIFYQDDIRQLSSLLGRDLSHWLQ